MADIIHTLRGIQFLPEGSIKCPIYIIPIRDEDLTASGSFADGFDAFRGHKREYYLRGLTDGEWHYDRTETPAPIQYPCMQQPWPWELPEGV